ncbi:MAG TPA: RNase adapter RapZ [Bacteroidales bacterium]|nr:RNase adapter RapZ [Bacteroidales bacterium]
MKAEEILCELFREYFGQQPEQVIPLRQSGSNRRYYRLRAGSISAIGTHGNDLNENRAFVYLTRKMRTISILVPELYAVSHDETCYLQQDIGDTALFTLITRTHEAGEPYNAEIDLYLRKAIEQLVRLQRDLPGVIDFAKCYPYQYFGRESVLFDLRYFLFYFAKIFDLSFDELKLEKEFERFATELTESDYQTFMYRDFQSRNIFIHNNEVFFIDYQAGRRGAPHYDLASLLYQAKAQIPEDKRIALLKYYMDCAGIAGQADRDNFSRLFYRFACIRMMQTLGAYGLRGIIEQKTHFVQSIPPAVANLKQMLPCFGLGDNFPQMHRLLQQASEIGELQMSNVHETQLTVTVYSFSYKKGALRDYSGNGGGFQFDCRGIVNPGKNEDFVSLTGLDEAVADFLSRNTCADEFVEQALIMASINIETYLERGFTHLMIGFGCTGGRHRSVYCAEKAAKKIALKYSGKNLRVMLIHKEQGMQRIIN